MTDRERELAQRVWDRLSELGPIYGTLEDMADSLFQPLGGDINKKSLSEEIGRLREFEKILSSLIETASNIRSSRLQEIEHTFHLISYQNNGKPIMHVKIDNVFNSILNSVRTELDSMAFERNYYFGSGRGDGKNLSSYSIAYDFAHRYMFATLERPTFAVSGGKPKTKYTRLVRDVFDIAKVRSDGENTADFKRPCEEAIQEIDEDDLMEAKFLREISLVMPEASRKELILARYDKLRQAINAKEESSLIISVRPLELE